MNSIGKKISEARKLKGFTQEELADLSKVNLRTIQRIENNENESRGKTLSLICDVLEIDTNDLQKTNGSSRIKSLPNLIINVIYLVLLNFVLAGIIMYLTVDSEANFHSKIGALLLSVLIPFFVVYFTQKMKAIERVLKFGSIWFFYLFMLFFVQGFLNAMRTGFGSWIFSCILLFVGVLFYGNIIFTLENAKNKSK
jgi:transcriptional regulator with XRE-family HTH domain